MGNRLAANNVGFYFDYQNGEYGFNTSETRGADTFSPFKKGLNFPAIILATQSGSSNSSYVYNYAYSGQYYLCIHTQINATSQISNISGGTIIKNSFADVYTAYRSGVRGHTNGFVFKATSSSVTLNFNSSYQGLIIINILDPNMTLIKSGSTLSSPQTITTVTNKYYIIVKSCVYYGPSYPTISNSNVFMQKLCGSITVSTEVCSANATLFEATSTSSSISFSGTPSLLVIGFY